MSLKDCLLVIILSGDCENKLENKNKNIQRGNVEVIYEDDDDWEEIETNK